MKKYLLLITLFISVLLINSCEKEDPPPPPLTGEWNTTFYISGEKFEGTMNLIQQNNKLTGDFVLSDGSGYTQILSSSEITGTSVTIEWMLGSYKSSFRGNVNSNYDYMSGDWYADGTYIDSWSATKTLGKSAVINDYQSINSELERLLKFFNK